MTVKKLTHFNVLEHFKDYTLIECQLETGRTHQIHCTYEIYWLSSCRIRSMDLKTLDIDGQALHAGIIGFEHPVTHEYIEKHATLPNDFEKLLDDIRRRDA